MSKDVGCFFKGMATGAIIGMSVCVAAKTMCNNHKCAKKKIGSAVKTASDFMENISYMLR